MGTGLHNAVSALSGSLAQNAAVTAQPAANVEWSLTAVGHGSALTYRYVEAYLTNGTTDVKIRVAADITLGLGMWVKPLRVLISNSIYAKFVQKHATASRIFYGGMITRLAATPVTSKHGDARLGISGSIAAGASYNVQPPTTEDWGLLEFGSTQWTSSGGGFAFEVPHLDINVFDGTNAAKAMEAAEGPNSMTLRFRFPFTNALYLQMVNRSASSANLAYSAQVMV